MNLAAILAALLLQTRLLAWPEAQGWRTLRSIEANRSHIDARLSGHRFVALNAKRNSGGRVAADHPRLIEMRE
jgi:hypothetical protein